jgi:hypothetical protein
MKRNFDATDLVVGPGGENSGTCDCCGTETRKIWGLISEGDRTVAAYFVRWTANHVKEYGADIDLILGDWGEGTSSRDRVGVSLVHFENDEGPWVRVVDAGDREIANSDLVGSALARSDVIGTPLAQQVFSLIDAVYLQDARLTG